MPLQDKIKKNYSGDPGYEPNPTGPTSGEKKVPDTDSRNSSGEKAMGQMLSAESETDDEGKSQGEVFSGEIGKSKGRSRVLGPVAVHSDGKSLVVLENPDDGNNQDRDIQEQAQLREIPFPERKKTKQEEAREGDEIQEIRQ